MTTPTGRTRRAAVAMVAAAVLLAPLANGGTASAQQASAPDEARQHFSRGKQLFAASDYRGAIAEFAAADKLAPSPLLEFNIALCHERLGERAEAVRRFRLYLERVPDAPNRATVEAKVSRLESEMKTEGETRRAAPVPVPPMGGGGVAGAVPSPPADEGAGPADEAKPPQPGATGDPELDRVAKIDIRRLRAERQGAGSTAAGPVAPPPAAASAPPADRGPSGPPPVDRGEERRKSSPVYKKWWFWVVVGVGAIVLYNIATADSNSSGRNALILPPGDARATPDAGGGVLLRF